MRVSVIIPTYNRQKWIGRAIRSVLEQDWSRENFEIIVINDGSADHTKDVFGAFGNSIKVINLPENKGLPYACNAGIKSAQGRFLVRVDDDDYVHPDFIKTLYNFLALNDHFDAVACDYLMVTEEEKMIERLNVTTHPIACGIMFRKDNLVDIGLYDEQFLYLEDEDLRVRYLKKYKIYRLELPLYRYTKHQGNMTKNEEQVSHYKKILAMKHGGQVDSRPSKS